MADSEIALADSTSVAPTEADEHPVDQPMTEEFYDKGQPTPMQQPEDWRTRAEGKPPAPEPVTEADPKPDEAKPDKADGPTGEAEPTAEKPGLWDRARQAVDIERANAGKRDEATQKTITDLMGVVKTMQANASAAAKPEDTTVADAEKEIETLFASLTATDGEGELTATAADVANVQMKVRVIDAKIKSASSTGMSTELQGQFEQVNKTLKTLAERMDAKDNKDELAESSVAINAMMDGFDKQYAVTGKEGKVTSGMYRNDVIATVRKQLDTVGFDEENLPHEDHVRLLLEAAYRKAFADDPKNKGKDGPKPKVKVPVDPGNGGATIPTTPKNADLGMVIEDMRTSGEFDLTN